MPKTTPKLRPRDRVPALEKRVALLEREVTRLKNASRKAPAKKAPAKKAKKAAKKA